MSGNTKEVKQRLNSINNTRKITKAMEMVAASKMRKSVENAIQTRSYHKIAWEIVDRLINSQLWFDSNSPVKRFFEGLGANSDMEAEEKCATLIVFTSNKGLCGAFNSNIIKITLSYLEKNPNTEIITIGNRGSATLSALGKNIALAYEKDDSANDDSSLAQIADHIYHKFRNKKINAVMVAYTNYKSAISQNATIKQLYPFKKDNIGFDEEEPVKSEKTQSRESKNLEYLYEPNKYDLLDYLTLRIGQAQLYQALLESNASEHSSRMVAMKNASDSAEEMAQDLILVYNKARQASITQEIAEISAGTAAVS